MDIATIRERVRLIEESKADYEKKAHAMEDMLYLDVLRHIAANCLGKHGDLAREALHAADIDFARYCA